MVVRRSERRQASAADISIPDGRDSIEPRQDCDEPMEVRTGTPGPEDEMGTVTAANEAEPDATIDAPDDAASRAVCSTTGETVSDCAIARADNDGDGFDRGVGATLEVDPFDGTQVGTDAITGLLTSMDPLVPATGTDVNTTDPDDAMTGAGGLAYAEEWELVISFDVPWLTGGDPLPPDLSDSFERRFRTRRSYASLASDSVKSGLINT